MRKDGIKVPFSTAAHTLETEKRQDLQSALSEDSYLQACVFTFICTLIGFSCRIIELTSLKQQLQKEYLMNN